MLAGWSRPSAADDAAASTAHAADRARPAGLSARLNARRQQRMREHLTRDTFGIQDVGLAALTRPIAARGAVRDTSRTSRPPAHEKHGRVPTPAGRVLDPPARDLAERPRPCLNQPVPRTGHPEMLARHQPAARVDDNAESVCLCGSIPTTWPARSGVINRCEGPGPRRLRAAITRSSLSPHPGDTVVDADLPSNIPVGARNRKNAPIRSSRSSTARTGADTSFARHRANGVRSLAESDPGSALDPTPAVASTGLAHHNTGITSRLAHRAGNLTRPRRPAVRRAGRGRGGSRAGGAR